MQTASTNADVTVSQSNRHCHGSRWVRSNFHQNMSFFLVKLRAVSDEIGISDVIFIVVAFLSVDSLQCWLHICLQKCLHYILTCTVHTFLLSVIGCLSVSSCCAPKFRQHVCGCVCSCICLPAVHRLTSDVVQALCGFALQLASTSPASSLLSRVKCF